MKGRRLGFGDFTHDGPNPSAQFFYLHAVSEFVPEALRALVALPEPETDAELARQTALHAWAEEWGFTDDWAFQCARRHAARWREDPSSFGRWTVTTASWEPRFPAGPSWNPIMETETAFRARVDAYVELVKKTPGIKKAPDKRGGPDHFKWLALHHVGQSTYDEIAAEYPDGLNIGSVSQAIKETAAIVGLTLRSRPGRKLG